MSKRFINYLSVVLIIVAISAVTFKVQEIRAQVDAIGGIDAGEDNGGEPPKGEEPPAKGEENQPEDVPGGESDAPGGSVTLSGYAWSSTIGWIHFSGQATNGDNYKVVMASNGDLYGYAWTNPRDSVGGTNNIGWLSFNETTGCPTAPCQPKVVGGVASGWARFITTGATDDGWDGWVRLSGTWTGGVTLGTAVNGVSSFAGYAWGGPSVTGWIHFCGTNYCVTASSISVVCSGATSGVAGSNQVTWSATPNGGATPYNYVWTGNGGLSGTTNPLVHTYSSAGTYNAHVVVSDLNGLSGTCDASIDLDDTNTDPPSTPTGLTANVAPCLGGTTATIGVTWNANPAGQNVTSYTLYDNGVQIYNGPNNFYTHSGLVPGSSHSYTVRATNANGSSALSSPPINAQAAICSGSSDTLSLKARPSTVPAGGMCTLYYSVSTNGNTSTDCTITGSGDAKFPFNFEGPTNGELSTTTSPIYQSHTYTLTCGSVSTSTRCILGPRYIEF